jgi:hypothetical protein
MKIPNKKSGNFFLFCLFVHADTVIFFRIAPCFLVGYLTGYLQISAMLSAKIKKNEKMESICIKNNFVEILFFSVIRLFSAAARRLTPSPPEGKAACGKHPLTPSLVMVFHQPSDDYRNIGG